jgi:hypothetical protein
MVLVLFLLLFLLLFRLLARLLPSPLLPLDLGLGGSSLLVTPDDAAAALLLFWPIVFGLPSLFGRRPNNRTIALLLFAFT